MSALAWPLCVSAAALIAVIVFLFMFREQIRRFIDRTKTIGKGGLITEGSALAIQEVSSTLKPSAADELLRDFDNKLLVEQEGLITKFLEEKNVQAPSERAKVLVRYLASAYLVMHFESIFHSIWGTQLRALEMLNSSEPQGLPHQSVEAWYKVGVVSYPTWYANYTYDAWFRFLQNTGLVVVLEHGLIHITVFGNEFLKYLVQSTYDTNKAG